MVGGAKRFTAYEFVELIEKRVDVHRTMPDPSQPSNEQMSGV